MAANDEGRPAGNGAAPDDDCGRQGQDNPREPPPPGFLDLGNGELWGGGTAADFRAASAWLERWYPDGPQGERYGPWTGRPMNMGYELTREARAGMPPGWSMGQRAVVLILADICNDRTRRQPPHMDVSERLCEELDITPGTLRNILTGLAAAGFEFRVAVGKDKRGRLVFAHKGHAVDYQFPVIPPRTPKGPPADGSKPVDNSQKGASVDAPLSGKGASVSAPSDSKAHPSMLKGASVSAPQTTKTPTDQKMTPSRVGDPIADKLHQDQGQDQGQEQPNANSENRRVHVGPETVAGEAQRIPLHISESATDGHHARAGEADGPAARRCDYSECQTPNVTVADGKRYHIGCELLVRRAAERAQAGAVAQ